MNTSTPSLPVLMSCDEGPRTVSSEPPVSGWAVSSDHVGRQDAKGD